MKGTEVLLIGVMVALVALALPHMSQAAYTDDMAYIERLLPAESREVETGGGETPFVAVAPSVFTNDAGYIERLLPAESAERGTGGGESSPVTWGPMAPAEFGHDAGHIERLLPAD